ncbi:MAG: hypothetical protein IPF93_13450 [Saprospiraceae bacterium]|nr:hypothetical protein [Saprospiraceae bacterium]
MKIKHLPLILPYTEALQKTFYTFVNWLPPTMMNREAADKSEAAMKYQSYHVAVGDTFS